MRSRHLEPITIGRHSALPATLFDLAMRSRRRLMCHGEPVKKAPCAPLPARDVGVRPRISGGVGVTPGQGRSRNHARRPPVTGRPFLPSRQPTSGRANKQAVTAYGGSFAPPVRRHRDLRHVTACRLARAYRGEAQKRLRRCLWSRVDGLGAHGVAEPRVPSRQPHGEWNDVAFEIGSGVASLDSWRSHGVRRGNTGVGRPHCRGSRL